MWRQVCIFWWTIRTLWWSWWTIVTLWWWTIAVLWLLGWRTIVALWLLWWRTVVALRCCIRLWLCMRLSWNLHFINMKNYWLWLLLLLRRWTVVALRWWSIIALRWGSIWLRLSASRASTWSTMTAMTTAMTSFTSSSTSNWLQSSFKWVENFIDAASLGFNNLCFDCNWCSVQGEKVCLNNYLLSLRYYHQNSSHHNWKNTYARMLPNPPPPSWPPEDPPLPWPPEDSPWPP